ncbi:hypothetical protein MSAN_00972300 [Mycena sanguinolenta]|uniref:Uncharacterized protein n=1 Tax=Mycena sanguinolenta TaxID=230812 RepID=A0A8H6YYH0_9AGAR|nr:hypothetical protein MSAN_00972300 [Mycena sanguinolenta]
MTLLSRLLAKLGNIHRASRANIAACNSPYPDDDGAPPDNSEERRSVAMLSLRPDSVIAVDSSIAASDGYNNDSGLGHRAASEGPQSLRILVKIDGTGNTVGNMLCLAGNHADTVNNYYTADCQVSDPNIQGLRLLTENQPKLLRITCVAIAFQVAPSIAEISRVLELPEDEVRQSIEAIANHLHAPIIFAGNIKFPAAFISALYRSCLQIMGAAHGDIARWCLQGAMSDPGYPRHINYAILYWAWHVSQATPSIKLTTALGKLPFVSCTVKQTQLRDVIHWLKSCNLPEAAPLVGQYEARLTSLAEPPQR